MRIEKIKFFDKYLGFFIILILSIFRVFDKKQSKFNKILVIQLWGIGETICTLPALDYLRKIHPKAKIDILTTERVKDVYLSYKKYDDLTILNMGFFPIISYLTRNFNKYDIVYDMEEYLNISSIISYFVGKYRVGFSHNIRSLLYNKKIRYKDDQHVVYTFLDLVDGKKVDKLVRLDVDKKAKKIVDDFHKKNNISKKDFLVGIAVGVAESAKSRMWPVENFARLADYLIEKKNARIVFTGAKDDKEAIQKTLSLMKNKNAVDASGKFNLTQTFYLIEKCKLYISNDTGPMHIAASQGVKTIGLFGPNIPKRFGPFGKGNISIYKGDVCKYSPCINVHKGQVPDCLFPKDSEDYQKCMKVIKVEDIIKAIR